MDQGTSLDFAQVFGLEDGDARRRSQPAEETVAEMYATMRAPLLGYAYQVVGAAGDAEDLVQVAFLRLFDQLRGRTRIENLRSWLYRVVHNLAIDHIRRQGKQESAVTEWIAQRALDATATTAEEQLIRQQCISNSLNLLNVRERYCLVLRAEGLSYKEIADVLSISAKAVSVYLARGLKKFEVRHDQRA